MTDDPFRQWTELEFRDGRRLVQDYLVLMMQGIPTHQMTYDEAVQAANKKAQSDLLNAKQDDVIAAHFRGNT